MFRLKMLGAVALGLVVSGVAQAHQGRGVGSGFREPLRGACRGATSGTREACRGATSGHRGWRRGATSGMRGRRAVAGNFGNTGSFGGRGSSRSSPRLRTLRAPGPCEPGRSPSRLRALRAFGPCEPERSPSRLRALRAPGPCESRWRFPQTGRQVPVRDRESPGRRERGRLPQARLRPTIGPQGRTRGGRDGDGPRPNFGDHRSKDRPSTPEFRVSRGSRHGRYPSYRHKHCHWWKPYFSSYYGIRFYFDPWYGAYYFWYAPWGCYVTGDFQP